MSLYCSIPISLVHHIHSEFFHHVLTNTLCIPFKSTPNLLSPSCPPACSLLRISPCRQHASLTRTWRQCICCHCLAGWRSLHPAWLASWVYCEGRNELANQCTGNGSPSAHLDQSTMQRRVEQIHIYYIYYLKTKLINVLYTKIILKLWVRTWAQGNTCSYQGAFPAMQTYLCIGDF